MSEVITLSLRSPIASRLEVEGITADRLALLSEREIADLSVWSGRESARLGDFFHVRGGQSDRVRVEGALGHVEGLAAGMAGGELIVDGDAGRSVAMAMTGGSVDVRGDVGDDAGVAMAGGALRVSGRAGDRLGAGVPGASRGMTGGEIVVTGPAGAEAAAHCRRGLVVVGGDAGGDAARSMIAGTLVVLGRTGARPGRWSKRGSIVAVGPIVPPGTYQYACTFGPPHVRVLMHYLRRRYGLSIDESVVSGRYRRYCGDAGEPGRGEILHWVAQT